MSRSARTDRAAPLGRSSSEPRPRKTTPSFRASSPGAQERQAGSIAGRVRRRSKLERSCRTGEVVGGLQAGARGTDSGGRSAWEEWIAARRQGREVRLPGHHCRLAKLREGRGVVAAGPHGLGRVTLVVRAPKMASKVRRSLPRTWPRGIRQVRAVPAQAKASRAGRAWADLCEAPEARLD